MWPHIVAFQSHHWQRGNNLKKNCCAIEQSLIPELWWNQNNSCKNLNRQTVPKRLPMIQSVYNYCIIIIRMHLYFYAVLIIAHVHAYSRFFKHCMNICHTWRTIGKTLYTTKCITTTYFHHRVPQNLMKWLCPFPENHKCNQLFNTLQSSSWTATMNIGNTCLNDVDTPAKGFMLKCLDFGPYITIYIHFQHQQRQLLRLNNKFRRTFPQVHLVEPFPPSWNEARGISKTSKWTRHHFAEGEVVHWETEGPRPWGFQ